VGTKILVFEKKFFNNKGKH